MQAVRIVPAFVEGKQGVLERFFQLTRTAAQARYPEKWEVVTNSQALGTAVLVSLSQPVDCLELLFEPQHCIPSVIILEHASGFAAIGQQKHRSDSQLFQKAHHAGGQSPEIVREAGRRHR